MTGGAGRAPASSAAPIPGSRLAALRRRLLAWYDVVRRDLPWRVPRGKADPYRAWLAEVMLQQTRVEAVLPYYRRFLARFPSLPALAAAEEEAVLSLWSGLGYYARGRNLLAAAREAMARHGGLPHTLAELRALPGFGAYTAGAVASIAFGVPAPAVDGNAARVLARLFRVEGRPEAPGVRRRLWTLAAELVPATRPGDWNQALMELGATLCGRPPACARCPVERLCEARRAGREREIPPARRRAPPRALARACAVVRRGERLLLARRDSRGLLGGLWELPGTEVAPGEDPRAALRLALWREFRLAAEVGGEVAAVERVLTHRRLRLIAFEARLLAPGRVAGARRGAAGAGRLRWAAPGDLDGLAISTAARRLLEAVAARDAEA